MRRLVLLTLFSCEGLIIGPRPVEPPPSDADDPTEHEPYVPRFTCAQPQTLAHEVRRLRSMEYVSSITQLVDHPDVAAAVSQHTVDVIARKGAPVAFETTPDLTASFVAIASKASTVVARDRLDRTCPAATRDCLRPFVVQFGRRALRRPLSIEEQNSFLDAADAAGTDPLERVRAVTMALLLDPEFLFQIEPGTTDTLTQHEFANRVAFTVTGRMPDAQLSADADAARLRDARVLEGHLRRLTAARTTESHLAEWLRVWLPVNSRAGYPQDLPASFFGDAALADASARYTRSGELRDDVTHFIAGVMADGGTFADVMSAPVSYPRTQTARTIYGTGDVAHFGITQRPWFLLSPTGNSNAIYRGVFIAGAVLCREPRVPDAAVIASAAEGDPIVMSSRQQVEHKTSAPSCQGCHGAFNGYGFALESFDGLGRARSEERFVLPAAITNWRLTCDASQSSSDPHSASYCPTTRPPYLHAIDTQTSIAIDSAPQRIDSARSLANALAHSSAAAECFSEHVQRFFFAHDAHDGDDCATAATTQRALNGEPLHRVLFGAFLEPTAWQRKAP